MSNKLDKLDFSIPLKFQELESGGFECSVPYMDSKVVGYGLTLEECEENFHENQESDSELKTYLFWEEHGGNKNIALESIEIPVSRQIHLLLKTKNRIESEVELREYFLNFQNRFPNTKFYYTELIKDK